MHIFMFSSLLRIISIHNKNKFVLHSFVIYSTFDCRDFIILHILAIFNQCRVGVVVRMLACHAVGLGSISLMCRSLFLFFWTIPNFQGKNKALPKYEIWKYFAEALLRTIKMIWNHKIHGRWFWLGTWR